MSSTERSISDHDLAELARQVAERQDDLVAAVERWSTSVSAGLDDVAAGLGVVEDALAHGADEFTRQRAVRALAGVLEDLAGHAAALRLGPPATAGYRLQALARTLKESGDRRPAH